MEQSSLSTPINCPFCCSSDAQFLPAAGRPASQGAGFQFPPHPRKGQSPQLKSPGDQAGLLSSSLSMGLASRTGGSGAPVPFIFYFFGSDSRVLWQARGMVAREWGEILWGKEPLEEDLSCGHGERSF